MEKIITIICNMILFLLLIFNVNDYADIVLVMLFCVPNWFIYIVFN